MIEMASIPAALGIFLGGASAGTAVALGLFKFWQGRTQAAPRLPLALGPSLSEQDLARIGAEVGVVLGAGDGARLDTLTQKLDQMRAEFDWAMGEQMIAQAVVIARSDGQSAPSHGLSGDELDAIRRFRRARQH